MKFFIFTLSVWTLFGCGKPEGYQVEKYKLQYIQELPLDRKIPVKAWELLEGNEPSSEKNEHGANTKSNGHEEKNDGHGGSAKPTSSSLRNTVLGEVKVFLVEKNPGVLTSPAIEISFPRGGGSIDLAHYTTEQKGSFFVGFDISGLKEATRKRVLFFSHARKRKLNGQVYGSGCQKYFDITDGFTRAMTLEGLKVNTTQDRHLTVLGGSFYFASENGTEMSVAQVRFFDSNKKNLFCQSENNF